MATGIVSRALEQSGARAASALLFGIAAAAYLMILTSTTIKAAHHRDALRAELRDPTGLFGHFTLVAASGVLATRLDHGLARGAAYALVTLAAAAWAALAVAAVKLWRSAGRDLLRHADGTWFLATVGLQALALTTVSLHTGRAALTTALVLWGTGVLLYTATLAAVALRLLHHPPGAAQLAPTYWVTMGAAAISTLVGARLLAHEGLPPRERVPLDATVTALWAWATLLIPLLLAAGVWRHLHHRVPVGHDLTLWCIVFPLGMYATATAQLATTQGVSALTITDLPLVWLATMSWLAVGIRSLSTGRSPSPGGR